MTKEPFYSVSELAMEFGLTTRAIRFYESKGLVAPQRVGTTRVYTHRERSRLKIILRGKRLGFSLSEIKEYLDLYDLDSAQKNQHELLLVKVRTRIVELEGQRRDLETTLSELREIENQTLEAMPAKCPPMALAAER